MSNSRPTKADNHALGPIIVPGKALPAPYRRGFDYHGKIDISVCRGRTIALSLATVAKLTGVCKQSVHRLLDAGVLQRCEQSSHGRFIFVLFDVGRSLQSYFHAWVERSTPPRSHAQFALYRRLREICRVWAGAPHPERILEAVFQKLKEIGNFTRHEVNGLIPCDPLTFKEISAWLHIRYGTYARQRHAISEETPVTWEIFAAALPEEFGHLPKTCLDQRRPFQRERPSLRVRHRVWHLDKLFNAGSLYAIIYAARLRRPEQIRGAMGVIARVEQIMRAHAPGGKWTTKTYQEALHRYAVDCDILPHDVPSVRDYTVRFWRIIVQRLRRYCIKHDPFGKKGLLKLMPPKFTMPLELRRELIARYGGLRPAGAQRRKDDSHQAFAELDTILEAAEHRRGEFKTFGDAMRAAQDSIAAFEAFKDFPVSVKVLDGRGMPTGGFQIETFRLWRIEAAWRSLADYHSPRTKTAQALNDRERLGFDDGFIAEHLHTVGDAGAEAQTSWMVRLCSLGVFVTPAYLPIEVREVRHEEIARAGLPGFVGHGGGLLGFDQEGATLARNGRAFGRNFVPVLEIERAIRFSWLALEMVADTMRRIHEIQQLLRRPWKPADILPGRKHFTQKVWPKVEPGIDLSKVEKVDVTVRSELIDEMLDLCDLHVESCGSDGFPTMQPASPLRWKCGEGEYAFSHQGRALLSSELNLFLRYLLVGWPPFTFHDFRHAGAEEAEFDGEPEGAIQAGLGHKSVSSTKKYIKLADWAQAEKDARHEGERAVRQDERGERRRDSERKEPA